jgi:hypothetical protein
LEIMGRGGDSTAAAGGVALPSAATVRRSSSLSSIKSLALDLRDDLQTLGNLWFSALGKKTNADHAARLESFYGAQAETCACAALRFCAASGCVCCVLFVAE